MVLMAKGLITRRRNCNFRYYCLAHWQSTNEDDAVRVSIYLKAVILSDYICAIESSYSLCLLETCRGYGGRCEEPEESCL